MVGGEEAATGATKSGSMEYAAPRAVPVAPQAFLQRVFTTLLIALVGLIAATIVKVFVANDALYWVTTYAGVLIFALLTAYDMQKLTRYGEAGGDEERRAIQGALALYLDSINLFLYLLRIFGRR